MQNIDISPDQNTVVIDNVELYDFVPDSVDNTEEKCNSCALLNLCNEIGTDDDFWPFPCLPEKRDDGDNGYFI
jgi:hypothetical protein